MTEFTVDVVTDFVCPWCFIGLTRLDSAIAAAGARPLIRHHPFFLDPSLPPEGVDVAEMLRAKYGRDPGPMFARVEAEARASGIPLDLSRQPRQRPTAAAHALTEAAAAKGTQHELAKALFAAHFLDSRNIADPAVLTDVAIRHGFSGEEVEALLADETALARIGERAAANAASGIGGVPFFVFDGRFAVSGAQPEANFREAIEQAAGKAA